VAYINVIPAAEVQLNVAGPARAHQENPPRICHTQPNSEPYEPLRIQVVNDAAYEEVNVTPVISADSYEQVHTSGVVSEDLYEQLNI
jgi:hypothetical protein